MPDKPDISLLIADLLSKHDEVVVSGIGTFFTQKQNFETQPNSNELTAPNRALNFRDSFQANDAVLLNELRKKYALSEEEAAKAIKSFATGIQRDLLLSHDCELPGLGILNFNEPNQIALGVSYLDLDDDFFGLSKLNYQPIIREKNFSETETPSNGESSNQEVQVKKKVKKSNSKILNSIAYLTIFLLSFGWFILANQGQNKKEDSLVYKPVPTRINVAPENPTTQEKAIPAQKPIQAETETEAKISSTNYKNVMLYAFSDPDNIEKAKVRIENFGYEPIIHTEQNLQTVQIKVAYESQRDLEAKLEEIKLNITQRAFIITE